jgi:hypothetical protein
MWLGLAQFGLGSARLAAWSQVTAALTGARPAIVHQLPLHRAVGYGHIDAVHFLLQYGANVNDEHQDGVS